MPTDFGIFQLLLFQFADFELHVVFNSILFWYDCFLLGKEIRKRRTRRRRKSRWKIGRNRETRRKGERGRVRRRWGEWGRGTFDDNRENGRLREENRFIGRQSDRHRGRRRRRGREGRGGICGGKRMGITLIDFSFPRSRLVSLEFDSIQSSRGRKRRGDKGKRWREGKRRERLRCLMHGVEPRSQRHLSNLTQQQSTSIFIFKLCLSYFIEY